jgi:hypothetical protein
MSWFPSYSLDSGAPKFHDPRLSEVLAQIEKPFGYFKIVPRDDSFDGRIGWKVQENVWVVILPNQMDLANYVEGKIAVADIKLDRYFLTPLTMMLPVLTFKQPSERVNTLVFTNDRKYDSKKENVTLEHKLEQGVWRFSGLIVVRIRQGQYTYLLQTGEVVERGNVKIVSRGGTMRKNKKTRNRRGRRKTWRSRSY